MNGIRKILLPLLFALLAACMVGFAACGPGADEVVGIQIATKPFVTAYTVGDKFDPSGLTVKAEYGDGRLETVADYMLSEPDMSTAGEKTVTVTYSEQSASFTITVSEETALAGIEIVQGPTKTRYSVGEELSLTGMIVNAKWADDTTSILSSTQYEASAVDMSTTGTKTVTITSGSFSDSFQIEVLHGVSFIPCGDTEAEFLYENYATDSWVSEGHRSADYSKGNDEKGIGAYFTYVFNAGSKLETALISVSYRFRTTMEVSFDNVTFTPLLQTVAIDQTLFTNEYRLENELDGSGDKLDFGDNNGVIYVRFRSTSTDNQGFGADVFSFGFYYTLEDESNPPELVGDPYAGMHEVSFDADTETEKKFLYDEFNTAIFEYTEEHAELNGLKNRYTTAKDGYFIYAFDVHGAMSDAVLQIFLTNRTRVEVSFDGSSWVTLLNKETTGNNTNANFDLSATNGFAQNTGLLYVRFSNAVAENGFGATMIDFRFIYSLADESKYAGPSPVEYVDPFEGGTLAFDCIGGAEETKFIQEEKDTYILGDDQFRTFNNGDGYVLYGFDFGGKLSAAELTLHVGQRYRLVQISFDGSKWVTVLENNPAEGGEADVRLVISDADGFDLNTGVLYMRCSGIAGQAEYNLCLYSMNFRYNLESAPEEYPAVTAAPALDAQESGTFGMKADGTEDAAFLAANEGDSVFEEKESGEKFRGANAGTAYFVYGFDFGGRLSSLNLKAEIGQQYQRIFVSFDGVNWAKLLEQVSDKGRYFFESDISAADGFAQNTGIVYLMFAGYPDNAAGFDITLYGVEFEYSLAGTYEEYPAVTAADAVTISAGTLAFDCVGGAEEQAYILDVKDSYIWNDTDYRTFRNGDGYVLYGFDFGGKLTSAQLKLHVGQLYRMVQISFDGRTWATVLNENPAASGGEYDFAYDLSEAEGFAANTGILYVRCSGIPGNTKGFDLCLYSLSVEYAQEGVTGAPFPPVVRAEPLPAEDGVLFFDCNGSEAETKFVLEQKDSYIFGDNQFRTFNDGSDGYVLYGFDFGGKLSGFDLDMYINQQFVLIEVSFDGTTWHTIAENGPDNPCTDGERHFTYDLSTVEGFSSNTGTVYLRCGAHPDNTGGYNLCILSLSVGYELENTESGYPPVTAADLPAAE